MYEIIKVARLLLWGACKFKALANKLQTLRAALEDIGIVTKNERQGVMGFPPAKVWGRSSLVCDAPR